MSPAASATDERLLVVTPVLDEAATIGRTAATMAAQTRRPDLWLVVDDGSRDATPQLLRELAEWLPFMRVAALGRPARDKATGLELAAEAHAFNAGLWRARWTAYDYVGKLDGDIELPPDYFASLLDRFRRDPGLGVAGGVFAERTRRGWRTVPEPPHHVPGALKVYRRDCLLSVGGVHDGLGWDTIDELRARRDGWRTRSFADLQARHQRPWGSAGGRLRGCRRYGACAHAIGNPGWWVALRALKLAPTRPPLIGGLAFAAGYLRARLSGAPRLDEDLQRFARRELQARLRHAIQTRKFEPPPDVLGSCRRGS